MNLESWFGILFVVFLTVFLMHQRHRLQVSGLFPALYFAMFRTKLGIDAMEYLGTHLRTPLKKLSSLIIFIGFAGMLLMTFELGRSLYTTITLPEAPAGVGIVQPFADGVPGTVFVPFFYFIISIFIIATVHEFSHGVMARVWDIKVKSSGFAFLGILFPVIPAAFVEPEESILRNRPKKQQLAVFAAGPVSNLVLAMFVFALLLFVIAPISSAVFTQSGVEVSELIDGNETYPAESAGLSEGDVIIAVNNYPTSNYSAFNETLHKFAPGETVNVTTSNATYAITLAKRDDRDNGFLGVNVKQHLVTKDEFKNSALPPVTEWFAGLFTWLFILNIGIGLFNLVPLGPIDGGRMLQAALLHFFSEKRANQIWGHVSLLVFLTLIANIVLSIVK